MFKSRDIGLGAFGQRFGGKQRKSTRGGKKKKKMKGGQKFAPITGKTAKPRVSKKSPM